MAGIGDFPWICGDEWPVSRLRRGPGSEMVEIISQLPYDFGKRLDEAALESEMTQLREGCGEARPLGWLTAPESDIVRGIIEGEADIRAIESVDYEKVVPPCMYDCLVRAVQAAPAKPAILALAAGGGTDLVASVTYASYLAQVTAAANLFRTVAKERRSVVAIMMPILPEALIATWGAVTAGVATPINPHLEPDLIAAILRKTGATVLITTMAHGPSAGDRLDEIVAHAPDLRRVLIVGGNEPDRDFAGALASADSGTLTFEPCRDREAEGMFLPTGGTTAAPKLARLTQGGIVLSGWIAGAVMGAQADEVIGLGMPLFHVGGMLMLGGRSAVLGQTLLLLSPAGFRDRGLVSNFWEVARAHGMTSLIATPTTAAALSVMEGHGHEGHVIRTFSSGGSTVPLELGRSFPRRFGIELREVWGSTEFHGFLGCQPNGRKPLIGSVGRRTPWHDIKAVELDAENRFIREMPPGEQGIIIGAGPCLALGYVDQELDGQFFITGGPDGRRWGSSGDLGRVDADGWVWIDGRAKDVIIRGGHNIDPAMIEELLVSHPAVLHAAAIGFPDASKGEMPVAYVELVAGATCSAQDLLQHCKARIQERAACPTAIFPLETMPLTPVGKIFKPALREMAMRAAVSQTVERIAGKAPKSVEADLSSGRPRVTLDLGEVAPETADRVLAELSAFAFESRLVGHEATQPAT